MSKRAVNRLQNLALVVLSLVAVGLLSQIPLLNGDWTNQVQAFLTHSNDAAESEAVNLSSALSAVHIVVTGDSEYGRYVQLYAPVDGPLFQQVGPLFQAVSYTHLANRHACRSGESHDAWHGQLFPYSRSLLNDALPKPQYS